MKCSIAAGWRAKGGRQRHASSLVALLAGALAPPASVGDLDPTFGEHGLLSLPVGIFGASALAIEQQPDGKLVLAGYAGGDFAVIRLLDGGDTDRAFSIDGIATVDFLGFEDGAEAVVRQLDGKLVLAGSAGRSDGTRDLAVVRFNGNGTLDAGFGDAGKVIVDFQGNRDIARSMVLQPDGKLVIAGETTDSAGTTQQILVRLNSDGSLDATFGADGRAVFGSPPASSWINDVELQADGKLVVVGPALIADGMDMAVARLTPQGELDPSFGLNGVSTVDVAAGDDEGLSIAIQPDSKIVIAGYTRSLGSDLSSALLVRLNTDGTVDNAFGVSGIAIADFGGDSALNALALDTNGKITATGSLATETAGPDMILARFNADGSVTTSFGREGIEIVDYGRGADAHISLGVAVVRQADGKYVAAGPNSMGNFSAARIDDAAAFAGLIGLTQSIQATPETTSEITYTVRRTGGHAGDASVEYATVEGDAEAGLDFEDATGTLMWADGDASDRTISIRVLDDAVIEPNESFGLSLSAPGGGAELAASEASTAIVSDDGPGQIHVGSFFHPYQPIEGTTFQVAVRRSGGSEGDVAVNYSTVNGSATSGTDFNPAMGRLAWADGETGDKHIRIQTLQDSIAEGRESFVVCLSNPTGGATIPSFGGIGGVLIIDDDSPDSGGGGGGTFSCASTGGGGGGGGDGGDGGSGGGGGVSGFALAWLALLALWRRSSSQISPKIVRSAGRDQPCPRGR